MNSLLHFVRFLIGVDQPASQVTESELNVLRKYALDASTVVELGCYEGKSMVAMAKNAKGTVYSVDPFFCGRLGIAYGKIIARLHAQRSGIRNFRLIEDLSWNVAPLFTMPIDFVFIDADHTYEAITRDWNDWSPKLRVGGCIALHNVKKCHNSPYDVGSMRFYQNEIPTFSSYIEVESVDSLVVFRKLS